MNRFLPLALIPVLVLGAWRREACLPDKGTHRPEVRAILVESRADAAPESSGRVQAESVERERRLQQRIAALETALQEALQKVDEHRAKLAKALNRRGPDPVEFLTQALIDSRTRETVLEAQIDVLEAAYVEHMAQHRRSD